MCAMTGWHWSMVEAAAQFLERDEREAVLGDLAESGESASRALRDVIGLAIRRNLLLWRNWRPWLAAFGLALPASFPLMGFSLSVSHAYQAFIGPTILSATGIEIGPGLALLCCNVLLLVIWSWTGGYVVGKLSRRTVHVSAAVCFLPCVFCLSRFHVEWLSRMCLLLFVAPAIWGVMRGIRFVQIRLGGAVFLAVTVTLLTIPLWRTSGAWIPNWALSWPAWYMVATAWQKRRAEQYDAVEN
jgi:hypothetical protein